MASDSEERETAAPESETAAPEEKRPEEPASARRSFDEVYREVVLQRGEQKEADDQEKGEES